MSDGAVASWLGALSLHLHLWFWSRRLRALETAHLTIAAHREALGDTVKLKAVGRE